MISVKVVKNSIRPGAAVASTNGLNIQQLLVKDFFYLEIETREERLAMGKPISEVEQILMDPMLHGTNNHNNDMNSFTKLVDGAERFGARIEDMEIERNEQLALGYQQPRGMLAGNPARGKLPISAPSDNFDQDALDHLNRRMEQEKGFNQMSNHNQPDYAGNQVFFYK